MKCPNFRYFRPCSLTWWGGVASIATGFALGAGVKASIIPVVGEVLNGLMAFGPNASPASLILGGLIAIGMNDKFHRAGL